MLEKKKSLRWFRPSFLWHDLTCPRSFLKTETNLECPWFIEQTGINMFYVSSGFYLVLLWCKKQKEKPYPHLFEPWIHLGMPFFMCIMNCLYICMTTTTCITCEASLWLFAQCLHPLSSWACSWSMLFGKGLYQDCDQFRIHGECCFNLT